MEGGKNGTSFLEGLQVFVVVVRSSILPAPEGDADPFEGQGANDGVKFFAFGLVVIDVVLSPLASGQGEAGEFMEGLPVKFGAGPTKIDHFGFTAAPGDRSNSAEVLSILRRLITRTVGAKEA